MSQTLDRPMDVIQARTALGNTRRLSSEQVEQAQRVVNAFHSSRPRKQCVACGCMIWSEHAGGVWGCDRCHRSPDLTAAEWHAAETARRKAADEHLRAVDAAAPPPRTILRERLTALAEARAGLSKIEAALPTARAAVSAAQERRDAATEAAEGANANAAQAIAASFFTGTKPGPALSPAAARGPGMFDRASACNFNSDLYRELSHTLRFLWGLRTAAAWAPATLTVSAVSLLIKDPGLQLGSAAQSVLFTIMTFALVFIYYTDLRLTHRQLIMTYMCDICMDVWIKSLAPAVDHDGAEIKGWGALKREAEEIYNKKTNRWKFLVWWRNPAWKRILPENPVIVWLRIRTDPGNRILLAYFILIWFIPLLVALAGHSPLQTPGIRIPAAGS